MLEAPIKKKKIPHVTQPHDKLVKKLLSNTAMARDILSLYLPQDVLKIVDLNHLELQRDSFIDDEHRAFAVDLLFKTSFSSEEGFIWILLEHQSSNDPWLPVRIFKYMSIIWEHLRKTSKTKTIPLIYPLIIYNGKHPYTHSLTLKEMIYPKESQKLFENLFNKPFHLIDLTQIKDESLRANMQQHVRGIALLMTLKHIFDKDLQNIFEQVLIQVYKYLDQRGDRDDLADMLYYLLNEGRFLNKLQFWNILHKEFSKDAEDKVMTIAQELRAEGFEEGMQAGIKKGFEKGIEKGIEKKTYDVAKKCLLSSNADLEFIANITGLSLEKIQELKDKIH